MQELQEAELCGPGHPDVVCGTARSPWVSSLYLPGDAWQEAWRAELGRPDLTATRMGAGIADGVGGIVSFPAGSSAVASLGVVSVPIAE